ncbi:MAG: hypothetical protein SPE23_07990 [Sodaliphilus sp.]|nr:hypothetical protein [Sodaliphilus sp.]
MLVVIAILLIAIEVLSWLLLIHAKGMSLRYDGIALRYDGLRYDGIVIGGFGKALSKKSLLLLGGWYFKRRGWYFGRVEVLEDNRLRYIFAT